MLLAFCDLECPDQRLREANALTDKNVSRGKDDYSGFRKQPGLTCRSIAAIACSSELAVGE